MASKQVADRKKSSTLVIAAAETHRDTIQTGAESLLKPHVKKGETMPDFAFVSVLLGRALASLANGLADADEAHERELSDDVAPREARDASVQALYAKVVEGAEILQGLYGAAALKAFKLDGITPRDGTLLVHYVTTASGLLRSVKLGKSRVKGATFDCEAFADELSALSKNVTSALGDVAREAREAEATLVKKNAAMAAFDGGFSNTASLLSALLTIGGQKPLALRVRPSSRRPGQVVSDEDATPADSVATD
jgi:hypothetical protein